MTKPTGSHEFRNAILIYIKPFLDVFIVLFSEEYFGHKRVSHLSSLPTGAKVADKKMEAMDFGT